jgi:hypothetical protein
MPHMIMVDGRASVSKQFEPEIDGRLKAIIGFLPVSAEQRAQIPRRMIVGKRSRNTVPAILGWLAGPWVVSPRVRDILEELEPGRHDYVPLAIASERPIAGKTEHGEYYLILPPPRLDAVVIEKTMFHNGIGREGFEDSVGIISSLPNTPCVLDARTIAGHHFWQLPLRLDRSMRDPSKYSRTTYFCSDELWRRLKTEKLDGWVSEKLCTTE